VKVKRIAEPTAAAFLRTLLPGPVAQGSVRAATGVAVSVGGAGAGATASASASAGAVAKQIVRLEKTSVVVRKLLFDQVCGSHCVQHCTLLSVESACLLAFVR
jgi:hypothetical protein